MLYSTICTTIVLFLMSCFSSIIVAERDIYVSPSGNDSSNCNLEFQCKTIDRALSLAIGLNSTKIFVAKGNYSLKRSHHFRRISSFGLFGNKSSRDDVEITCHANVSVSFILSENITFEGVKFRKCGAWFSSSTGPTKNYPNAKHSKFKAALDFRYCRNLWISHVEISLSPGLGANLYDVGGVVNVTDSWFTKNYARDGIFAPVTENGGYVYSGGGMFIILNQYGYDTVDVTPSEHDSYHHNNSYVFTRCHFLGNKALRSNVKEEHELNTLELSFTRGGGLAVYFRENASDCIIEIKSCNFSNNKASWGGGLQVEMSGNTENNSFVMQATVFRENHAVLAGGGARLGNVPYKGVQLRLNRFKISNCTFKCNKAARGGGTTLYGTTIPRKCTKHTDPIVTQFHFLGCKWLANRGNIGAALGAFLYNENDDFIGPEVPYHVCFENDTLFRSNEVILSEGNLTIGQGSLYSVEVPLIFRMNAQFVNNSQTALVLDGSTLAVHNKLDFINNTGFKGGAIAMYGRSRIVFNENSTLNFDGNSGNDKGGALYIQTPGSPLVSFNATGTNFHACFFGYSDSSVGYNDWNTSVIFKDNTASLGKSVYATTLENCRRAGETLSDNSVLRWTFVKYSRQGENNGSEVATDPVELWAEKKDWEVAPGEVFDATVILRDEVRNSVPGVVNVSIISSSVNLGIHLSPFLVIDGKIRNVSLHSKEVESMTFSVKLNYIGGKLVGKTLADVRLKKCHPGFTFSEKTSKCECMSSSNKYGVGVSTCLPDGKTLLVKKGYWAGNVEGKFVTYFCPLGYCNSSSSDQSDYRYLEGHVCKQNRTQTSILCGECKNNYSVIIGSEDCRNSCTYWHLFYLIPIGLALIVVVVIIMLIDLDFFTGYLNAWLYSYQVMKLLTPDEFEFDSFIEFFIALSNIRIHFGDHGFCLAKGLDDADKLMIMYAIPTYVIVVVWLLTKVVGAYPNWCFSKRVKAPFRAVCTILVLCYTDITRISLRILDPAKVGSKTVVFVNGELDFFQSRKHVGYAIVAIIYILVFVIPFPLILLFRPFLTRGLRPVLNLNRWKPFFDAFQSCLKDEYRWCAAFYFLCRLGILVIHTFMPASSIKRVLLEGICILILAVFTFLRPYKEARDVREDEKSYEWINKSDVVVLTALCLIAVASSPIYSGCANTPKQKDSLKIVVKILAYIPLLVLLALAYRVLKNYCPGIADRCLPLPQDADTLPVMSETSDTAGSQRATPVISETSVSQQSTRGSHQSSRGSQQSNRENQPI